MEKRKYGTREEKQVLVKNYSESGLSRKAWCSKNNIPISNLVGWVLMRFMVMTIWTCFGKIDYTSCCEYEEVYYGGNKNKAN